MLPIVYGKGLLIECIAKIKKFKMAITSQNTIIEEKQAM
jgi:hypothetical protein